MTNIPLTTAIALIALMFLTGFLTFAIYIYIKKLKARFSLLLKLYMWFILGTLMLALFSVQIGSYLFYFIIVFFSVLAGMQLLPPALIDWRKSVKKEKERRKRLEMRGRRRGGVNVVSSTLLIGIVLMMIYILFPLIVNFYAAPRVPQFDQCAHAILGVQAIEKTSDYVDAASIRQCQLFCTGRVEAAQCDVEGIGPLDGGNGGDGEQWVITPTNMLYAYETTDVDLANNYGYNAITIRPFDGCDVLYKTPVQQVYNKWTNGATRNLNFSTTFEKAEQNDITVEAHFARLDFHDDNCYYLLYRPEAAMTRNDGLRANYTTPLPGTGNAFDPSDSTTTDDYVEVLQDFYSLYSAYVNATFKYVYLDLDLTFTWHSMEMGYNITTTIARFESESGISVTATTPGDAYNELANASSPSYDAAKNNEWIYWRALKRMQAVKKAVEWAKNQNLTMIIEWANEEGVDAISGNLRSSNLTAHLTDNGLTRGTDYIYMYRDSPLTTTAELEDKRLSISPYVLTLQEESYEAVNWERGTGWDEDSDVVTAQQQKVLLNLTRIYNNTLRFVRVNGDDIYTQVYMNFHRQTSPDPYNNPPDKIQYSSQGYINDWLAVGEFDDFDKDYLGGEASADPIADDTVLGETETWSTWYDEDFNPPVGGTPSWFGPPGSDRIITPTMHIFPGIASSEVLYLFTRIFISSHKDAVFYIKNSAPNARFKLWVNGTEQSLSQQTGDGYNYTQAALKYGWNRILLKTTRGNTTHNSGEIFFRVLDTSGQPLQRLSSAVERSYMALSKLSTPLKNIEFIGLDTETQGDWQGTYGSRGYILFAANRSTTEDIVNVSSWIDEWTLVPYETWPGYLETPSTDSIFRSMKNNDSTADRALQHPVTGRIESEVWYRPDNSWERIYLEIPINVSDSSFHNVSLYFADYYDMWNNTKMSRGNLGVQVLDSDRRVLEEQTLNLTDWHTGVWFKFKVKNDFIIRLDSRGNIAAYHKMGYPGVFFD